MIQPKKVHCEIPFLTSDEKTESLKRYLDSTEPRIVLPRSYIRNYQS